MFVQKIQAGCMIVTAIDELNAISKSRMTYSVVMMIINEDFV